MFRQTPRFLLRRRALQSLSAVALLGLPALTHAQSKGKNQAQSRALTLIVPSGAGSTADIVSTAMSTDLAALLQYPVQLKNTNDATNIVDTIQALARAAPDGDTVGMIDPSHLLLPFAHASLPFDPAEDFTIVSVLGGAPLLLLTNPAKVQATTAQELIAAVKANPGVYRDGVAGQGSALHLAVDLFLKQTGLNALATPYSGEGTMLNALADQGLDFCIATLPGAHGLLTSNVVRALGVCSGMRLMAMPTIPTLREQVLPMYEMESWCALLAPAGISSTQASTVYSAFRRALSLTPTKRALEALGITLIMMPPDQSALIMQAEM